MKPLDGVKILDLSQYLPGPLCCQMFADFGAEVIKIEPLHGELLRTAKPQVDGNRAHFYCMNRNKKSLALNLKSDEGKQILKELVKEADVLFEQYRPGVMDKLGLGYDVLNAINPRLIYCALTGYGYSGPMKLAAGHDCNYLSIMGLLDISGNEAGPGLVGTQIADIAGGTMQAFMAVLLALRARDLTGRGQFCDVSMVDGLATMLTYVYGDLWGRGSAPKRAGNDLNGGLVCYNLYECSDGKWVSLGALEPAFWKTFCEKIGKEEWIPIGTSNDEELQDQLKAEARALFKTRTQEEWVEFFADCDICFAPILSIEESIEQPQVVARDLVIKVDDFRGSGKTALFPGIGIKLSDTPGEAVLEFSNLGEDTAEILAGIGYGKEQIDALAEAGVVGIGA